ncbi:MAG: response regulator transcription factor [Pseudomonadota bacterium]
MTVNPIRVMIADDHPLVTEGLCGILETYANIDIVGVFANGREVVDNYPKLAPDIVLLDLNMPELGGIATTEILLERDSDASILILSMHDAPEYVSTAMRHGAKGYLLKDVAPEEIITAIQKVHAGETFLCATAASQLKTTAKMREPLTSREQTILLELASGKSNKQVAYDLDISVRTVETHRKNIKRKLGISTTAGLTRYALEHGVLQ